MNLSIRMQSPEFAALPAQERANVVVWEDVMRSLDAAPNKSACCRDWAARNGHRRGWSMDRIRAKYYGWLASGRAWTALVDWAAVPKTPGDDRRGFAEAYKTYVERNQRAAKPAWRAMIRDLRRGVNLPGVGTWRDVWARQYPGESIPERCPQDWIPRGWLYSNCQRKAKLTTFEIAVARKGMTAARQFAPAVYSTRVGLEPGRIYQFDDVWHDVLIAVPGVNRKLVRPLEFGCIDVASTYKPGYGMRPQIRREDGSREGLGRAHFKALIAHMLCNVGWHPDGTVFVIEHGSASLLPADQELVTRLTDGKVSFRTSEILGRQLHGFKGQGHGNFKAKALIESSHRLIHYEAAALPAQTGGMSRTEEPEQLYGLQGYAAKVLEAWERVPQEQRDKLWFGDALTFTSYRSIVDVLYSAIYSRTDHAIEGWEENEWMEAEWSIDGRGDWRAARDIATLPEAMRDVGRRALTTPGCYRLRRMSPREVWDAHKTRLVRLPAWAVVDFLGDDCYRTVTVGRDGLIAFQDRELTGLPCKYRYAGMVMQPDGSGARLTPGVEYGLYVLPHNTSAAVVVDARRRTVLGVAPAWSAVDPLNKEQVGVMVEAQARMLAMQAAPIRARHAAEHAEFDERKLANDLLLGDIDDDAPQPRARVGSRKRSHARNLIADLAAATSSRQALRQETVQHADEW